MASARSSWTRENDDGRRVADIMPFSTATGFLRATEILPPSASLDLAFSLQRPDDEY
jgi:hypothetical protein